MPTCRPVVINYVVQNEYLFKKKFKIIIYYATIHNSMHGSGSLPTKLQFSSAPVL